MFVGEGDPEPWIILTDRQKGIIAALEEVFPRSNVRFCAKLFLANIKNKVKQGLFQGKGIGHV